MTGALRARVALIAATVAVSSSAIAVRLADTNAATVVTLRMTLAVFLLLPWAASSCEPTGSGTAPRRDGMLVVASGLALAVHFLAWTASLALTGVATSVLLVSLHPVMVAPLAARWMGEQLDRASLAGIALALSGTVLACAGDVSASWSALGGDLLALLGAVALAAYLMLGRRLRRSHGTAAYSARVYAVVAVAAALTGAIGGGLPAPAPQTLLACAFLALICTVGGHTVFNWALRHVRAATVSVAFLAEAPLAGLLALVLLGERPQLATLASAPLILGGLGLCLRAAPQPAAVSAAP